MYVRKTDMKEDVECKDKHRVYEGTHTHTHNKKENEDLRKEGIR